MAWLQKGSRGWFFRLWHNLLTCFVAFLIDFSSKALSVYPSFLWLIETDDKDCGVNCPAKEALLFSPCHFFQPGMCASSLTTYLTFPQLPSPSTQHRNVLPRKPETSILSASFEAFGLIQSH